MPRTTILGLYVWISDGCRNIGAHLCFCNPDPVSALSSYMLRDGPTHMWNQPFFLKKSNVFILAVYKLFDVVDQDLRDTWEEHSYTSGHSPFRLLQQNTSAWVVQRTNPYFSQFRRLRSPRLDSMVGFLVGALFYRQLPSCWRYGGRGRAVRKQVLWSLFAQPPNIITLRLGLQHMNLDRIQIFSP